MSIVCKYLSLYKGDLSIQDFGTEGTSGTDASQTPKSNSLFSAFPAVLTTEPHSIRGQRAFLPCRWI